jgi:hypothetical protein
MCCGKNRPSLPSMGRVSQPLRAVHQSAAQASAPANAVTYFQYNGRTAMTVQGSASGTVYRFHAPGRRVVVDLGDRASLAAIPLLSEVGSL